jgi:hypothetical protein
MARFERVGPEVKVEGGKVELMGGAMRDEASIRTLLAFLHEELATVAGYRRALSRFSDANRADELRACLASHERRIATLAQRIRFLGGDPDAEDPAAIPAPALGVGDDAAIAALEESEDRGLKHYLDDVCKLDRDTRTLVAREILPEQVRTYDSLSDLKLTRRI